MCNIAFFTTLERAINGLRYDSELVMVESCVLSIVSRDFATGICSPTIVPMRDFQRTTYSHMREYNGQVACASVIRLHLKPHVLASSLQPTRSNLQFHQNKMDDDIQDILADISAPPVPQRTRDLQALTRAWINERTSPELLPYPTSLVDRIMDRIKTQVRLAKIRDELYRPC
jgi:hypothetical protein